MIPLVGGNVMVAAPSRAPCRECIIADVRFEIAESDMGHIVRRLESRVREARA